jgi:hypothetical protein
MTKFCRDCAYYKSRNILNARGVHNCLKAEEILNRYDIVTGESLKEFKCIDIRFDETKCGQEGKWFSLFRKVKDSVCDAEDFTKGGLN